MVDDLLLPLDDEELGSGERCQRCGDPLLVSEARYCSVRKGAGMNCSAIVARIKLAADGVLSYAAQLQAREREMAAALESGNGHTNGAVRE